MKAITYNETGYVVFYLSDDATCFFNPYLKIRNSKNIEEELDVPFMNENNCTVHENVPTVDWKPNQMKVVNGQWVDCSAEVQQKHFDAVHADVQALVSASHTAALEVQKTSQKDEASWSEYHNKLDSLVAQTGYPFTLDWPEAPDPVYVDNGNRRVG